MGEFMFWVRAVVIASVQLLGAAALAGPYEISNDPGGRIGQHDTKYAAIAARGDSLRITGRCASACTVVLHHFSRDRICLTSSGYFGFHTGNNGRGGASFAATDAMLDRYPSDIKSWIYAQGGLSKGFIYLRAPESYKYFRKC